MTRMAAPSVNYSLRDGIPNYERSTVWKKRFHSAPMADLDVLFAGTRPVPFTPSEPVSGAADVHRSLQALSGYPHNLTYSRVKSPSTTTRQYILIYDTTYFGVS